MSSPLTLSGNEITALVRAAAASLTTASSGQMEDGRSSSDPSLGIRRAATNLFRRGQCDATTDWAVGGSGGSVAVDATVPAPFSTQSMKYTSTTGNISATPTSATGQALAAGVPCVSAIYFIGTAGLTYQVQTRVVNTDASTTDGTVVSFTAGSGAWPTFVDAHGRTWEVLTAPVATVAVGKTGDSVRCVVTQTGGIRAESFWVAHAMLEKAQSVVAPYVATSGGATTTHVAGRVQAPATLLTATQGWVAMRVRMGISSAVANGLNATFWGWFTAGNPVIDLRGTGARLSARRRTDAGVNTEALLNVSWNAGDVVTVVMAWDATGVYGSFGGSAFLFAAGAYAATTLPATIDIGSLGTTGRQIDSDVLWFACGTGRLTDADAAKIAAFWDSTTTQRPIMPWDFPPDSGCTGVYNPGSDLTHMIGGVGGPIRFPSGVF